MSLGECDRLRLAIERLEARRGGDPDFDHYLRLDVELKTLLMLPSVKRYVELIWKVLPPLNASNENAKLHRTLHIMLEQEEMRCAQSVEGLSSNKNQNSTTAGSHGGG